MPQRIETPKKRNTRSRTQLLESMQDLLTAAPRKRARTDAVTPSDHKLEFKI